MFAWVKRFKRDKAPAIGIAVGQVLIRLLLRTCRLEVRGLEGFLATANAGACVLMLWHDRLALMAPIGWRCAPHLAYAAFVSASRDGRLITEICESYPNCRVITVSHDGRHHALRTLIQQLRTRKEVLLMTPDGPRGPRHKVKAGLALAARTADVPVVPFTWSASRFWQLGSWDRLILPKPFSKVVVQFGQPIHVDDEGGEAQLENALNDLTLATCQAVTPDSSRWPK